MIKHDDAVADILRRDPNFAVPYLRVALEEIDVPGGEEAFLLALKHVVEARGGMTEVARRAGLSRESLYRSLSAKGNPTLRTLSAVMRALDVRFADIVGTHKEAI